uniref:Nuclear transcription factor Y subunit n=1 Tax=Macrostomum lignano TaxID=282301 RepID=A0A1I8FH90_9PLAT
PQQQQIIQLPMAYGAGWCGMQIDTTGFAAAASQQQQQQQQQQQVLALQTSNGQIVHLPVQCATGPDGQLMLVVSQTAAAPAAPQPQVVQTILSDAVVASPKHQPADTVPAAAVSVSTNASVLSADAALTCDEQQSASAMSSGDAATGEEPLYVNAKQYHRILKRRRPAPTRRRPATAVCAGQLTHRPPFLFSTTASLLSLVAVAPSSADGGGGRGGRSFFFAEDVHELGGHVVGLFGRARSWRSGPGAGGVLHC